MADRSEISVSPTFPGARWLATHQATVDNVLAGTRLKRRVVSRGDRFYNRDHWTALRFTEAMLQWMRDNPGSTPVRKDVAAWVSFANINEIRDPLIVIAHTPEKLTPLLAHALVGGGCHEGWHTRDSCRRRLTTQEMWNIVRPRWGLCPDWSVRVPLLEPLLHVIEDIKLERRGIERMPATRAAMVALQEFIWAQEGALRLRFLAQGGSDEEWFNPAQVFIDTFRDLGLGYNTATSRELIQARKHFQPKVVHLIKTTIKEDLLECIHLEARDQLGFIRKALEIVGALERHAETFPQKNPEDDPDCPDQTKESTEETPTSKPEARRIKDSSSPVESEERTSNSTSNGANASFEEAASVEPLTARALLDSSEADPIRTLGAREALARGIVKEGLKELRHHVGEASWRPWDTSLDTAKIVEPSADGKAEDQRRVRKLLNSMRQTIAQLRAKFRSLMRAKEMRDQEHGLPQGIEISERMLTDTFLDLCEGKIPKRAYVDEDEAIDNSVAVVVSRDQSSSTKEIQHLLDQAMLAVTEPIENIGGQVMCFGWRMGSPPEEGPRPGDTFAGFYHRVAGVHYDIFKTFGERFAHVQWRFVNTQAVGNTPMADGIEYGLMALSQRSEAHRILFMVTDGRPPRSLIPIIRGQLRRAREAGITVVAVATGSASCPTPSRTQSDPKPYVAEIEGVPLFDHWVFRHKPEDLPGPLVTKLTRILDQTASKRGKRIRRGT